MHNIVSDIANDIKEGFTAPVDEKIKGLLSGEYEVMFKAVDPKHFDDYLGHAVRYYEKPFRAIVMFWPDKNNVLPFESGSENTVQSEALGIV